MCSQPLQNVLQTLLCSIFGCPKLEIILVINFIDNDRVPCHVIIGMFETLDTFTIALEV
jgi:hypothetical protein